MNTILQVFLSVFSGALLAAAIPNELYLFGCPFITLFALIPFYLTFYRARNYKEAILNGFVFTASTHLFSSFWLSNFKDFAALTLGASAVGTGAIGASIAFLMYLPYSTSAFRNRLNENSFTFSFFQSPLFRILYFSSMYVIYEWVKSCGFLGYPWATLASTIYKWPAFMQLAAITGTYGITFILALINAILAEIYILWAKNNLSGDKIRIFSLIQSGKLAAVLLAVALVYGVYQCNKTRIPEKYLKTIFVQQNSDPWKEANDNESILNSQRLTQDRLNELQTAGLNPDLIVWSEGTLKYSFPNSYSHYRRFPKEKPLVNFIQESKTPLLAGGSFARDAANKVYFNAAIMFDLQGNYRGCYGKNHLVPVAEAVPGMEIPAVRSFLSKVIGISAGWYPGDQYVYFDIPCDFNKQRPLPAVAEYDLSQTYNQQLIDESKRAAARIATPICYDDAFPDIMGPLFKNGAEVYINITDDSWSLKKSSEYQHFVIASYSTIEYRTPMLRSTNAGYSVVLSPTGKILADLPLFQEASGYYSIPIYKREVTTYARFGNWLPYTLIFTGVLYSLFMFLTFTPNDYFKGSKKIKLKHKKHHKK